MIPKLHGRQFSLGTAASSTNKTGCHDIAEILLKVALKHQKSKNQSSGSNSGFLILYRNFTNCKYITSR